MNTDKIAEVTIITAILAVIVLKICNIITWSWALVLAPIWIPFLFGCLLCIPFSIILIIYMLKEKDK